ncbi:MAG: ABC transporter permease [Paracoccaceae bacterium]|jgi:putative ABC transport system permease protein|nr:ABC transporter permease [Paracoccaceae bacterium]
MTRAALAALLSHWRRRPGQLATLLLGLALATALWSAVQAINAEARASYARAAGELGLSSLDALVRPGKSLSVADFAALRRAGWLVSPVLEGRMAVGAGPPVSVLGVDFLSAPQGALPVGLAGLGEGAQPALLFTAPGLGFAAPDLAARLSQAAPAGWPEIRADAAVPPGQVLTDIGAAERMLARPGEIDRLLILPGQPLGRPPLAEVAPGLVREAGREEGEIARLTSSFHLNLTAFGLLSFAVGLFIVHGAIGLAVEQRRGTVRTLRALGLPTGRLVALLLVEVVVLALVAGAAGVALGYVIAAALLPDVAATLRGLYGASVPGVLSFDPGWAAAGLAMAIAGALVAAGQGLWRVARLPVLEAARPRAWATVSGRALRRQAAAGAALLAAGIAAPLVADGLAAGFALLAGLLLGAALILPLALSAALALGASRARRPLAEWFWADTRQQLPGLSLALMALMLALAANIGVSTMVGSFRLTFTGWLDQRLAADLYARAGSGAEAEAIRAFAEARGAGLLPTAEVEARLAGAPGTIRGITDHPLYAQSWPLLSAATDVWERVARGEAALVNEQLARRAGLATGDPLELGPGWALPVAGIYSDYGNPRGEAMVALSALQERVPQAVARDFGLVAPEGTAADDLRAALIAGTPLTEGAVIDQGQVKQISLAVFERTFAVTGALNVLTLAVAGVAMLTALLTLATMRLPQLAPVWALGLTRARLGRLDMARSGLLAALTFVAALPLGLAVAWALLAVVNVEAFGWRLPMHLFPRDWAFLLALSVAAALLAALIPARRLARTPPAAFLKVFADER